MNMDKPPFDITNEMLSLVISITEKVTNINSYQSLKRMPILRRNNRIRSIHSSLIIEANSLTINQVKDVIAGKVVIGPKREIQEVKNAYKAYEQIGEYDAFSENDLLKANSILTSLLVDRSGKYRNHREGGDGRGHSAAPAARGSGKAYLMGIRLFSLHLQRTWFQA